MRASQQDSAATATCWLCERPLGRRVQQHHVVPKAKRGKATVPVHQICHRTIHARFTNAQLVRFGGAREPLLADEEITRFLRWIADKPPEFYAPTRRQRR